MLFIVGLSGDDCLVLTVDCREPLAAVVIGCWFLVVECRLLVIGSRCRVSLSCSIASIAKSFYLFCMIPFLVPLLPEEWWQNKNEKQY
jgi:hypothetical protein